MVPPGQPTQIGSAQSVSPSLLRSNSGMLGGQGGPGPSQTSFPSLVAQRTQFNNMNMLGNMPNVASLLNQSYQNGIPNSGLAGPASSQRAGGVDAGAESDPLSGVGNGMNFGNPMQSNLVNHGSSGQGQGQQFSNASGNQMLPDQQHSQQLEAQNFQQHGQQSMQQFSAPLNAQQQQQHFQSIRGGMGGVGPVKLEPQVNSDQFGQQQLPSRNLAQVKLEPQQLQTMRNMAQVKMEPQHTDQQFLHQQQQHQQQQLLHMSRQSSQAAAAQMNHLLQQQRIFQYQQHQQQHQQQLLKGMPQQRSHLPQQFQQQNMPMRSPAKSTYEPGMCARRLTHYMYQQQHRPEDNNIEFWRKFVAEYFAPNAKKKWCVSMYGSVRQTTGVLPQDVWHCEICNRKPGRGFEATAEVLPRLFKIKYESGTLEELLYVDMPREYHNSSGQIVLDYAKAIQESVFEQLRVVRDGQLRIVFSPDLKICSWEFCARRHEELIPRRLLIPQVSQLGAVAQKYQAFTQNATPNLSVPELQNNCNMFVASARQLAKALEVPLVNDLGYTKRYVRCLQISEVVNSMKDLIDYSRETGTGPMDSLAKFPRRTGGGSSGLHSQAQQSEDQLQQQSQPQQSPRHMVPHTSNGDPNSVQTAAMQIASSNGVASVNNSVNAASASTTTSTIVGLLHQNSMNSRQNSMNNASSPYGGSSVQIPSPGSSGNVPQAQPNASPFQSPTPSSSNNPQTSHPALTSANHMGTTNSPANISLQQQQTSLPVEADPSDAQSSVQKIIHEMMMSSQMNGTGGMTGTGSLGNDMKNVNGILPVNNSAGVNSGNGLVGNGTVNSNSGVVVGGYGTMGLGPSGMTNGMRPVMGNNSIMNGRGGMASLARDQVMNHQQDLSSQLLSGLGAVNGFNNLQFDWKPSP
ncbi:transcriptional corepressor SEUSS [Cajanus cajan]|uniref:Transcriptional corepressor SEUSS n=1 Tax=Cajanus cajan TaxID=3821 RepID=A0A151TYT5_CAJCA|nr:transcriptional corepressor SEUSS [Cajanus cajan]XP_020239569.1 transcriptional corepressor SEUSS [Cajanus cajan]XP_029129839.1 transcriptional corepressor SEUSS [Cajanus cajan]KYP72207.1 Transcriptional corepressor SEUSS [Cajanus cajan]